ncbi:MAG: hypothetical protein CSA33_07145 [Desulfobulbus propionicus]|nr:MAG: hypothetical protein CSA33_07145 [Desulfobulbus propionicus]
MVVHPEMLVQLRESNPRTPRVLTVAEGNTEASVIGEDVEVRRSQQSRIKEIFDQSRASYGF